MCFAPQRRALFQHLNFQRWSEPLVCLTMFNILASKRNWRHNRVHFFNISSYKSGLDLVYFVHFDFEMCFARQRRALFRHINLQKYSLVFLTFWLRNVLRARRRALFRHLNFQKWSGPGVVRAFWLRNVLRATTVCTFSTSQRPKVVRHWGVLCILTWKRPSRHNGVQFFISHLARWLRNRRFSEPTFRPSGATNHLKNTVFRGFATFLRACIFFLLTFSSLLFSLLLFSLLLFSSLWLFPSLLFICPYCRKFDF